MSEIVFLYAFNAPIKRIIVKRGAIDWKEHVMIPLRNRGILNVDDPSPISMPSKTALFEFLGRRTPDGERIFDFTGDIR